MTRETTKLVSVVESVFKGTDAVYDDINDLFPELNQMQDLPETIYFDNTEDEDLSFGLSSKYVIKWRKPQASIYLNLPTHVEEYPEFKVKTRKEKNRVKELLTQ